MTSVSDIAAPAHPADGVGPRRGDALVLFTAGMLMALGVAIVYSASVTLAGADLSWAQWWRSPLRQCVFALAGLAAMILVAHLDYRFLAWAGHRRAQWGIVALVVSAGLLLAMLLPGVGSARLGSQRSLVVPGSPIPLTFQPAEVAKLGLVLWLSAWLTRPGTDVRRLRSGLLPGLIGAGLLIGLTGIEDFGTAALMGAVTIGMLLTAGARWLHLTALGVAGGAAGAALILLKPYRLQRLLTFLSEAPDPSGEGYQVAQSLIAIGSGGWWGRGLGAGVQKYGYLPQDNNDFVFAVLCEELGILGGLAVVLLFLILLGRGWQIARRAPDPFGRLLAIGITLLICLQAAFNIGVVTDSVPTKGISLPLVSAGGSGVLVLGVAAGLLSSVGGAAIALNGTRRSG